MLYRQWVWYDIEPIEVKAVKLIINNKVSRGEHLQLGHFHVKENHTALKNSNQLFQAAESGEVDKIIDCIKGGSNIEYTVDIDGRTPLYIAVKKGHEQIVNVLIANKADVNKQNKVFLFYFPMNKLQKSIYISQCYIKFYLYI